MKLSTETVGEIDVALRRRVDDCLYQMLYERNSVSGLTGDYWVSEAWDAWHAYTEWNEAQYEMRVALWLN